MGTYAEWPTLRRIVVDAFQSAGQVMTVAQEAPSLVGILGLVTAGVGITIFTGMPRFCGEQAIAPRPIVTDPPVVVEIASRLAAGQHSERHAPLHRDQPEGRQGVSLIEMVSRERHAGRNTPRGSQSMENWANRKTLILGRSEMIGLLKPDEYNDCVEQAYRMHGEGRFYMDPKGHIVLDRFPGEWEAMPSYIEEPHAAACKWVSIREQNRERFNLPTVFSILIYTHPETGFPLAIVDGSYHTVMRTGAAAAVSAKWMARKDSRMLAIVGAGHMAEGALATCNEVFPW